MPIGLYSASLKVSMYCGATGSFRLYLEGPGDFTTPTYNGTTGESVIVNCSHTFYLSAISGVKQKVQVIVLSGSFLHNSYAYNCYYTRLS